MQTQPKATVEDLYRVPENGKAELVNGELVLMSPTGFLPGHAAGTIYISLRSHQKKIGKGRAVPDNVGFIVNLPNRQSFSPDAAYHTGPTSGMKFLQEAPIFAVEVRSEGDYGPQAERELEQKRRDYFAAGTEVVWDVDLLSPNVIRKYNTENPENPVIFRRGEAANAEPAVPGWRFSADELFE